MKKAKRKSLQNKGWKVGGIQDFLGLTDEEIAYIELKLALTGRLKSMRKDKGITQVELAKLLKSSQSRVAKIEAGDPSVSLDLLVKALLALGATPRQIASAISKTPARAA